METWGTFTIQHIISIIIVFIMVFIIYKLLKNKTEKVQKYTLFILSLWGIAAIIYNLLMWNTPIDYLPLHLCSINALLLPISVLTKNKFLGNLLPIYSIGALAAIVINTGQANYKICSSVFLMYYVPHMFEFIIPLLQVLLGRIKMSFKYIIPSIIFTFILYTIVHLCNIYINYYLQLNNVTNYLNEPLLVNYMYSLNPEGNPVFEFFYKILPYKYYYMLLLLPVFGIICLIYNIYFNKIKKTIDNKN